MASRTKSYLLFRKGTFEKNLHYVLIYYILDNLIWLCFPLTPIEKSNRPIVYHVVRLLMRFKQGELKVSRHTLFVKVKWGTGSLSIINVKYRTWIFIGEGSLHSGCFMPGFWCACRKVCCQCKWCLCWNGTFRCT